MHAAIVSRQPQDTIAWLTQPLNGLSFETPVQAVTAQQFLNHAAKLSLALPEHTHAINLCDNRYLFMVSLCAVILRGGTNLLPPNKNIATQAQLVNDYERCIIIHDAACELSNSAPCVDLSRNDWQLDDTEIAASQIALDHLAVICFTSGSTGQSKPNLKYWRTLVQSTAINADYMLHQPDVCHAHIATVPGQHMWGFETSVLLALFANVALVDARPFFPLDIVSLINSLPTPCSLISTPFHLKSLSMAINTFAHGQSQLRDSSLTSILCATAPLKPSLAKQLEQQTKSKLLEVYGCSEVGSMAVRRAALEEMWTPFAGLQFSNREAANSNQQLQTLVTADHLPDAVLLEDHLKFVGEQFELLGRSKDQINIAGKRGSLTEVNSVLNEFEGSVDGIVFLPQQTKTIPRLAALVVLAKPFTTKQLRAHMAKYLDAAFVPRPIINVEALPREDNGKLSQEKVLALYESLRKKK